MKIIAVMSPKGGIGKTTTSDSIAYMLGEEQGKRVLVLDGDPQGDTSKTFGVYEPDGIGMSELLEKHECVGGTYKTGDLIRPTDYSHIDIIPANGYLMKTDMNLLLKSEDNQVTRMTFCPPFLTYHKGINHQESAAFLPRFSVSLPLLLHCSGFPIPQLPHRQCPLCRFP